MVDAASGASVHSLPQGNASKCEARLQQRGNRETNHHCVHAHCVKGGLGHDHELLPKLAADQETVDAVTSQRDTITRTAADTEVLFPFAQDPDQASTVAPPDDERDLFGRDEALRMDEEIMDVQWFEHVTWDSIKDFRGTMYVQTPTRFKFALQQAQHAILRAIIHNNPSSLASDQPSSPRSSSKRSFGTGTVSSDRTELKKVNFVAAPRPDSPIRPRLRQDDWRQGIASDKELIDRALGKLVGTGGSAVSSTSGQLPTSAEIEEVGGSRAGHWTRSSTLRKMQHAKCILRATSDGWQACLHVIRSCRRAVTD